MSYIKFTDPEFTDTHPRKKTLPPDPEGQNDDRAAWAQTALEAFQKTTRTDAGDAVSDLLGDLMHWCDRNGSDFEAELERARRHYSVETESEIAEEEQ